MITTPDPARSSLVAASWAELPEQLQRDCTLHVAPGVRYHARLDVVFVVLDETTPVA